jgi:DNA-binding GntR family transcriptional regulator
VHIARANALKVIMADHSGAAEKLDYTSIGQALLSKLREEILDGSLSPGQRLQQTEIADRFGISRMPVRDVLRRLEEEGLVSFEGGRVARVASLDPEEVAEVYDIRMVLEELAARKAAPNITDEDLVELSRIEAQMEKAAERQDLGLYLELDRQFHLRSYAPCQSPRLLRIISRYWATTQHYRRAFSSRPGRIEHAIEEHRQILARFEAHDVEGSAAMARQVLQEAKDGILRDYVPTQTGTT